MKRIILLLSLSLMLALPITNTAQAQSWSAQNTYNWTLYPQTYQAESVALFNRMTTQPTPARKVLIDACIKSLKNTYSTLTSKSLWNSEDVLVVTASHDAQSALLNWKGNYNNGTAVNSPTFAVDRGYTGASTKYLNTNYAPSTHGVNYSLNSASFFVYYNTNTTAAALEVDGSYLSTSSTYKVFIQGPNAASDYYRVAINCDFAEASSNERLTGLYTATRAASNSLKLFVGGVQKISSSLSSNSIPDQNVYVLAAHLSNNTANYYSNDRVACYGMGAGLSAADVANLNTIISTYLTAIGGN